MRVLEFTVPQGYGGVRLKGFLRGYCQVSARLLTALKRVPGGLLVNGSPVNVLVLLQAGDRVQALLPEDNAFAAPMELPLAVLFEDEDLLAVEKPAGLTMYPTPGHNFGLVNTVSAHFADEGEPLACRPIYRLDRDTTGVTLFAKNAYCAAKLADRLQKTYYAVCRGELRGEGRVEAPIAVAPGRRVQRCVASEGQHAATRWRALQIGGGHTLLALTLETGRTHQIRVHMAHLGHPLAGDDMYGGGRELMARQALHCGELCLAHPVTGAALCLRAPLPKDMAALLLACGLTDAIFL